MMNGIKVILIHAYNSNNKGDGLLVEESINMIRESLGQNTEISLVASYPDTFAHLGLPAFRARPSARGYSREYMKLLLNRFDGYDLVVGVGGGYLRFGTFIESVKTSLVMLPQLFAVRISGVPTVFLPQSIGPSKFFPKPLLRWLLKCIDTVWLRDDRSVSLLSLTSAKRSPDIALLQLDRKELAFEPGKNVVVNARSVHGKVPPRVAELCCLLERIDGYIQSSVAGNNDQAAVESLNPVSLIERKELVDLPVNARVVVAVRLHAALMAMAAGHFVIHLSYERKGFGAFQDLGLEEFVYNVNSFNPKFVIEQIQKLENDEEFRREYNERVRQAIEIIRDQKVEVLSSLRHALKCEGRN